jgi:hypothetical protein
MTWSFVVVMDNVLNGVHLATSFIYRLGVELSMVEYQNNWRLSKLIRRSPVAFASCSWKPLEALAVIHRL